MDLEKLIERAYDAIIELDEDEIEAVLNDIKASSADFKVILEKGFSAAMSELGEQFSSGEIFMPDLIFAADLMSSVTEAFNEYLSETSNGTAAVRGKVCFATVEGDVHDIGKGICISLANTKGIEMIDLGRDVSAEKIVDEAEKTNADIIALSAMLTTTMQVCESVIKLLNERGIRDKYYVMIGGAPVTSHYAGKISADLYSEDGPEFANEAAKYIAQKYAS